MDLSFLCIVGLVLVVGGVMVAGHKFRWKTIDYMGQKLQNPTLEPPKIVKFGNRLIRYVVLAFVILVGAPIFYTFISAGRLIAASIVGVLVILVVVVMVLIGSYWKDNFDL